MSTFLPFAWYWKDGTGRLYSSAKNELVTTSDETFEAWFAAGNVPTVWPRDATGAQTDASLNTVLTANGLPSFAG